jgi:methylmalonyl-CoA epimerase
VGSVIKGVYGANIAVKDLDAAIKKFTGLLGQKPSKMLGGEDFAVPGLKGAAFDLNGFILHIIASDLENTSISKFVNAKGEGIFLLSLSSDNVEEDMVKMTEAGASFIMEQPMKGKFGTANFIHPKSAHGVQIELYDPDK